MQFSFVFHPRSCSSFFFAHRSSLVDTLATDVAGISADDITILSITSGSIVVEFEITSTAAPDAASLSSVVNTYDGINLWSNYELVFH